MALRLVFTDLDDTLFSTARKQARPGDCRPVSWTAGGHASGLASPAQQALWEWVSQWGDVVPVTARSTASLQRVSLDFAPHAVWNQGACVRVHGVQDEAWRARALSILAAAQEDFLAVAKGLSSSRWPMPILSRQPDLEGHVARLVLRVPGSPLGARAGELREEVSRLAAPGRLWVHAQRDWLAVLPCGLTKRAAVRHLIDVLKPSATVGVGDSFSDIPFLRECDFCVLPRQAMALDAFGAAEEDAA